MCVNVCTCEDSRVPTEKDTSWKMPVAAYIRVLGRAAATKPHRLVAYKQQKLFPTIMQAGSRSSGCQPGGVQVRAIFLAHRWLPPRLTCKGSPNTALIPFAGHCSQDIITHKGPTSECHLQWRRSNFPSTLGCGPHTRQVNKRKVEAECVNLMRMGGTRGNGGGVAQRGSELRPNNHLQQKTERLAGRGWGGKGVCSDAWSPG